ncbi:MAG: winged helix-turn-helix transcriptional regulator, partial [Proteobacteria bacterium]|nr:winged helix-turn-helix transcriptional regulator [Pseudomonadota bacterium]
MDRTDRKLLALLQHDASLSHAELAERVNLSPSQCSRRIQRLNAEGVIRAQVALLDE